MGAPWPVLPYEVLGRVTRELGIEIDDLYDATEAMEVSYLPATAGELIDLLAQATTTTPDSLIPCYEYPSVKELEAHAFDRVRSALGKVGAQIPDSLDDEIELPIGEPKRAWTELSKRLDLQLPYLLPTRWKSKVLWWTLYPPALIVTIATSVVLLHALDPPEPESALVKLALTLLIYPLSLIWHAGIPALTVIGVEKLLLREHVPPFESVRELVNRCASKGQHEWERSLRRVTGETTVRSCTARAIAEVYRVDEANIGAGFRLVDWPE